MTNNLARIVIGGVMCAATLAACGTTPAPAPAPAPAVTVTETEAAPEPEPTVDIIQELMGEAWRGLSAKEQASMCILGPDFAAAAFLDALGSDNPGVTLNDAKRFFAGVC